MNRSILSIVVLLLFAFGLDLHADEIKLKSGEVIKNCKVKSKRKGKWSLILVDGSRRTIKEAEVDSHVEKPTIGDEFDARLKKVGKKDLDGFLKIGKEAMKAGAKPQAVAALLKVTRIDRNHEEAHKLLGAEKCEDGKWRRGRALEKYKVKAQEARYKKMGWKKIKGNWVDPVTARYLGAGFVKIDDEWYSKEDAARMKSGEVYVEGAWYKGDDKAKLAKGMRRYKGKWQKIRAIDAKRRESEDHWVLEGRYHIVTGPFGHSTIALSLRYLEDGWNAQRKFFGEAPLLLSSKDKIRVRLFRDRTLLHKVASDEEHKVDDRNGLLAYAMDCCYSAKKNTILVHYHSPEYLAIWSQMAGSFAFQERLLSKKNLRSNFIEAVGSYFMGFKAGQYVAFNPMVMNGFRNWVKPEDPLSLVLDFDITHREMNAVKNEARFARLGFLVHYLRTKHPEVIKAWIELARSGEGSSANMIEKARELLGDEGIDNKFRLFLENFVQNWKEPKVR